MEIVGSREVQRLAESQAPWFLFAEHRDLAGWIEWFRERNVPHVVVEGPVFDGRRKKEVLKQQLWIRYRHDPYLGVGNSKSSRKPDTPPTVVEELVA